MTRTELVSQVAGFIHNGQLFDAAKVVARFTAESQKIKVPDPKSKQDATELVSTVVHWLLNEDDYESASKILWSPALFSPDPYCTRLVWKNLRESANVFFMGASSMSKTYGCGVFYFCDWLRDPEHTTVKVLGPSENHLQDNLFSHLVSLHRNASIPLPGHIGDLFIGLDLRNRRSSISGVVVPLGRKGAGRLQGVKRFPRKTEHPVFGKLSRVRVLLDEIEKIPVGIWSDIDNIVSNVEGVTGLKIGGAFNPQDSGSPVYVRAEPQKGWPAVDVENDEVWVSKRGWTVVRLDAHKSENVQTGKIIYPGLATKEGLEKLAQSSGGVQSAGYFTFGRAMYPPQGTSFSVIPASFLTEFKARFIFVEPPRLCAAVDSALEGSDPATMATGEWGLASGLEFPPSDQFPEGRTVLFRDKLGRMSPRWGLQVTALFNLLKGDTILVGSEIRKTCRSLRIDPGWLMLDRTGNGAGVHDWLLNHWSPEVRGINYSETASHTKIMEEDKNWCDEEFDRVYSELWFALRSWVEFAVAKLSSLVPTEKLYSQFTSRLFDPSGKKRKVESKRDYKSRGHESPNEADAVTLLVHCVRMAARVTPSMSLEAWSQPGTAHDFDDGEARIGVTDRLDDLDSQHFSIGAADFDD